MKEIVIALTLVFAVSGHAYAQSTLSLQEKCLVSAKKYVLEHIDSYGGKWGSFSTEEGTYQNHFESHYNKRLHKCFIKIICFFWRTNKKLNWDYTIQVYDVSSGKTVGVYSQSCPQSKARFRNGKYECDVYWGIPGKKTVFFKTYESTSEQEKFEALIKSYMDE